MGSLGNVKRNFFHGPGFNYNNLSLYKDFPFGAEKSRYVEIRVEGYNAFNHANFSEPDGNYTDGAGYFGVVTSVAGSTTADLNGDATGGRAVQLVGKILFLGPEQPQVRRQPPAILTGSWTSVQRKKLYRLRKTRDRAKSIPQGLRVLRENHRSGLSPAGTPELSPGRQSWVSREKCVVPQGRLNPFPAVSVVPAGLLELPDAFPGLTSWAKFRRPCVTEPGTVVLTQTLKPTMIT